MARRAVPALNWLGLVVILAVLVIWQLLVTADVIHYSALPGPVKIASGFRYIAGNGMWSELGHTVYCVGVAWAIAVAGGGLLGLSLGLNATVASWTGATVDLFRSLPVVGFIPIAILVWGNGTKTEVILGAYAGIWPMVINTAGGVRGVAPRLHDVAKTLRLSRAATLVKIILPSTGGSMLVGARLALTGTLVVCVVSEMLGLQTGIGNALMLEQAGGQPSRMWAYVVIVGILGILANLGLAKAVKILFPGVSAMAEASSR